MIVAVATQKGGSAKTTTTVNLGAALAERGNRVAIVDMDPQGHATYWLLGPEGRQWGPFVHEWLNDADVDPTRETGWPGLSIIAANQDLARIREAWDPLGRPDDVARLSGRLAQLREDFDWILLDCPASFDVLTISALLSADGVIIPVGPPEPLAVDGAQHMVAAIRGLQLSRTPRLRLLGVLVSNLRLEHAIQRRGMERLEQARLPLFSTTIASSARVGAAAELHRTLLEYAPRSFVADSFRVLSLEVEKRSRGWLWNWVAGTAGA